MTRWYSLDLADADFLASAPHIFRYQKRFAAPPQRVWESLASDESVAAWGPSIKEVRWTAPRPFGVGTTREVALAGGVIRLHERFFRWDEGTGYSFSGYEATVPGLRRFAGRLAGELEQEPLAEPRHGVVIRDLRGHTTVRHHGFTGAASPQQPRQTAVGFVVGR